LPLCPESGRNVQRREVPIPEVDISLLQDRVPHQGNICLNSQTISALEQNEVE